MEPLLTRALPRPSLNCDLQTGFAAV